MKIQLVPLSNLSVTCQAQQTLDLCPKSYILAADVDVASVTAVQVHTGLTVSIAIIAKKTLFPDVDLFSLC